METFVAGDKVELYGRCYIVSKIDPDNMAHVRAQRSSHYYPRFVRTKVENLKRYEPAPKVSANAKTCQICGRLIHAKRGKIAHHGYERPRPYLQTQSCFGAMHLPYEVDRSAIARWIGILHDSIRRSTEHLGQLRKKMVPLYKEERKRDEHGRSIVGATGRYETEMVKIEPGDADYDRLCAISIGHTEQDIRLMGDEIIHMQKRYDDWKRVD